MDIVQQAWVAEAQNLMSHPKSFLPFAY